MICIMEQVFYQHVHSQGIIIVSKLFHYIITLFLLLINLIMNLFNDESTNEIDKNLKSGYYQNSNENNLKCPILEETFNNSTILQIIRSKDKDEELYSLGICLEYKPPNQEYGIKKECDLSTYTRNKYFSPFLSEVPVLKIKSNYQVFKLFTINHQPAEVNSIPWRHMKSEWWRLHTFSNYPRETRCSAILLAKKGFIYIGNEKDLNDDTVLCVFCQSAAKDLTDDTNIDELHHAKWIKTCPMISGQQCENIMMKEYSKQDLEEKLSTLGKIRNVAPQFSDVCQGGAGEVSLEINGNGSGEIINSDGVTDSPMLNNENFDDVDAHLIVDQESNEDSNKTFVTTISHNNELTYNGASALSKSQFEHTVPPVSDSYLSSDNSHTSINQGEQNSSHNLPVLSCDTSNHNATIPQDNRSTIVGSQTQNDNSSTSSMREPPAQTPQTNSNTNTGANSYEKLGIITARPKRHEYAVEVTRVQSFEKWPANHHIKAEDLARAGYFFTGYNDCARCFYCGGGLRNWEVGDDVWVEHARWFPKCAFMRQSVGQSFIDVVQDLNKQQELISFEEVIILLKQRGLEDAIPKDIKDRSYEIERDVAVKAAIDFGFSKENVMKVATVLKESGQALTADAIYDELIHQNIHRTSVASILAASSIDCGGSSLQDENTIESLKGENNQLRQQSQCKICMDREVSVVFLPCGHLISCNECSFALRNCPVCRDSIKGVVRAYLS